MSKRPPLNIATLKTVADAPAAAPAAVEPAARVQRATPMQPGRAGKEQVGGYFPKGTKRSLALIKADTGLTTQQLLEEGLIYVFRKYRVPVPIEERTDKQAS